MQNDDKQNRDELQKLFVNWLIYLLDERYGVNGWGTAEASRWSVTLGDGSTIQVGFKPSGQPDVQGPAKYEGALASIVEDANRRTVARDYGTEAWWIVSRVTHMRGSGVATLHLMRLRKEHMPRRFQGDWRLGSDVLVSFRQTYPSTSSPIPMFDVDIAYRVLGPGPGPFSQESTGEGHVVACGNIIRNGCATPRPWGVCTREHRCMGFRGQRETQSGFGASHLYCRRALDMA